MSAATAHPASPGQGPDPNDPLTACPASTATTFLGRSRVCLRAEGRNLVAYGFGNQVITIPAAEIGSVVQYRQMRRDDSPALLVLDHDERMLLRASGRWDVHGEVTAICAALKLNRPKLQPWQYTRKAATVPARAPGYRRLNVAPRSTVLLAMPAVPIGLTCVGLASFGAAGLVLLLPGSLGAVRGLLATAAGVAGALGGWLVLRAMATLRYALMWWAASRAAGSPAPAWRFFQYKKNRKLRSGLLTAFIAVTIPAVFITGPIIGLVSLVHGFSDQALVATLRQHGARTPGLVIDDPGYDELVADHPDQVKVHTQLAFYRPGKLATEELDPAIGGKHWPIDPDRPVTVVYNPANPEQAAVLQQIEGSPWSGAPITNVIAGGVLTVSLPFLVWGLVVRVIRVRRRRQAELLPVGES